MVHDGNIYIQMPYSLPMTNSLTSNMAHYAYVLHSHFGIEGVLIEAFEYSTHNDLDEDEFYLDTTVDFDPGMWTQANVEAFATFEKRAELDNRLRALGLRFEDFAVHKNQICLMPVGTIDSSM